MNSIPYKPSGDLPDETYRLAQAGETHALEAIIRHHQQGLRAWIAAHCPVGGDADDVAQRTFVAAITRLGEFQIGTSFAAWLFTIARYQLLTESTRLRRLADYHSRLAPDLLARELERRSQAPDDSTQQRLHHLRHCLSALGEAARRLLEWRYADVIPLQEMAARTGRSEGALKKQLWQLRQKLQQCIEGKLAAEQGVSP